MNGVFTKQMLIEEPADLKYVEVNAWSFNEESK